jgi:carbon-monoxide dehydrogenase large subunit
MPEDGIGVPLRRREDRRFLTGRGRYVHDIVRPQQLHAVFLRSPHAHAEIVAIEKAEALASRGVAAIFTAEDVAADRLNGVPCAWGIAGKDGTPMKEPPHPPLAQGKVRHVGDPVVMVIAESVEAARDAAERIGVEYRILTAVTEAVAATAPEAPQLYEDAPGNLCCDWAVGDATATDAAFARAHHIAKIDLVNNRLVPNAMESRAALAEYEPATGDYTLYTSTQLPHVARVLIGVLMLGIPERKLRVIAPDVGGGFGSKQVVYAEEALVTWAARKLERPVKWVADRSEAFQSDAQGRDHVTHAELALDRDGRFLGLRVSTLANIGGYVFNLRSQHSNQPLWPAACRRLYHPGHLLRGEVGVHEHRADRCLSRRRGARKPPSCWSGWSILRRAISVSIASKSGGATLSRATSFRIKPR